MASLRTRILALASPTLDSDRPQRLRCITEAKKALAEEGCDGLADVAAEAGERFPVGSGVSKLMINAYWNYRLMAMHWSTRFDLLFQLRKILRLE